MQRMVTDGTRCSYKDHFSVCVRGECEVREGERERGREGERETKCVIDNVFWCVYCNKSTARLQCKCLCSLGCLFVSRKWAVMAQWGLLSRRITVGCVVETTPAARPSKTTSTASPRNTALTKVCTHTHTPAHTHTLST